MCRTLTSQQPQRAGESTGAKHVFHHWCRAACCDPPGGEGGIYRLIMSMCPSRPRCPPSRAQRKQKGHTLSFVGPVKLLTKQVRVVSGRAAASPQTTNKSPQRFGKTKRSLLRQQKKALSTQEHYQILRYEAVVWIFLYTEKKQLDDKQNSRLEFQKGESTTKEMSSDGRPFPQTLQTNSDTSPKALWEKGVFSLLSHAPTSHPHV